MCIFGGSKKASTPAPPPPVPQAPTQQSAPNQAKVEQAQVKEDDRLKRFKGQKSTLLTSPFGTTTEASTEQKTLLGA